MDTFMLKLLAIVLCASALPAAFAQQEPPPEPPSAAEPDDDTEAPVEDEDDVFIPTEEIPADEEITFPVNI